MCYGSAGEAQTWQAYCEERLIIVKPTIEGPAGKGRNTSHAADGNAPSHVQNPERERVDDVMRALKLSLMTAGLTMDECDPGSDPYNSRPGHAANRDIWNGSRRRR